MGKRMIIAAVFISFALAFSLFAYLTLEATADEIISLIDEISALSETGEDSSGKIDELAALWDKKHKMFGIFLKHEDADTLDRYFIKLTASRQQNWKNDDVITDILCDIRTFLLVAIEGEKVNMENIF